MEARVEYPLLGEPPVVEFVNTLYVDADGVIDFLGTVALARGWFHALEPAILSNVERLDDDARHGLIALRSAIRALFDSTTALESEAALGVVASAVNASPGHLVLSANDSNRIVGVKVFDTTNPTGTGALLADAAVQLVTGRASGRVLVCDRPSCNMRFFQQHRRRRYCNPACANSDRQTRFQHRHKN